MNTHIHEDELALFAVQLLDEDEAEEILLHLSHCEHCRHVLAGIQGDLAIFAMSAETHSPPALARERLLEQVRREGKAPLSEKPAPSTTSQIAAGSVGRRSSARRGKPTDRMPRPDIRRAGGGRVAAEVSEPRPKLLARLLPWVGWAIAAGLAMEIGDLRRERDLLRSTVAAQSGDIARLGSDAATARQVLETLTDGSAMRVTLTRSKEAPVPVGRVHYLSEKGQLVFTASNMEPLGPYRTYELWLIPADGRDPIPAGTFRPDAQGSANVILPELPKGVPAKAFGITQEDEGGSQTPTMPIVMAGT